MTIKSTHRDMCVRRMRTDFSTLLILLKGRPSNGAGVHNVREDTRIWTKPGRNLTRPDQLFKMAEMRSGFLIRQSISYIVCLSEATHSSDALFRV
jgi:hypothetical protein